MSLALVFMQLSVVHASSSEAKQKGLTKFRHTSGDLKKFYFVVNCSIITDFKTVVHVTVYTIHHSHHKVSPM